MYSKNPRSKGTKFLSTTSSPPRIAQPLISSPGSMVSPAFPPATPAHQRALSRFPSPSVLYHGVGYSLQACQVWNVLFFDHAGTSKPLKNRVPVGTGQRFPLSNIPWIVSSHLPALIIYTTFAHPTASLSPSTMHCLPNITYFIFHPISSLASPYFTHTFLPYFTSPATCSASTALSLYKQCATITKYIPIWVFEYI